MSVIVDGSNGLIFSDASTQTTAATGFGFKNRVINGDFRIDQRNAGASVATTTSGAYNLDRWSNNNNSGASRFTVQQNAGSVTPPVGFANYLGCTSTGAYSIAAGDVLLIRQNIEGYNIADLAWGTASASAITLSFWVRSSLTGTFGGSIKNPNAAYSYPFTYTINAANTWEYETIVIPGPTASTWNTSNSAGIEINLSLGTGATYAGTAGAWAAADYRSATGGTSVVGTSGATFYITGVQLEKGSTATAFDYRDYGREFVLCQRYYETTYPVGYSAGYNFGGAYPFGTSKPVAVNFIASDDTTTSQTIRYAVVKRTSPTVVIYSGSDGASGFTLTYKATGGTGINVAASVTYTSESLWNINQQLSAVNQANESYFHFTASAEL